MYIPTGTLVAAVTPFRSDDIFSVDTAAIYTMAEFFVKSAIEGAVIPGCTIENVLRLPLVPLTELWNMHLTQLEKTLRQLKLIS